MTATLRCGATAMMTSNFGAVPRSPAQWLRLEKRPPWPILDSFSEAYIDTCMKACPFSVPTGQG